MSRRNPGFRYRPLKAAADETCVVAGNLALARPSKCALLEPRLTWDVTCGDTLG